MAQVNGHPTVELDCALPVGHGPWHEHAPGGVVLWVWADPGHHLGEPGCPYESEEQMLAGPYQLDAL